MKYLTKRRNITITTTDKDAAVVILDTGNYIKEANCQIPNKTMTKHFKQTPLNNTVKWWLKYLSDLKMKTYSLKIMQKDWI